MPAPESLCGQVLSDKQWPIVSNTAPHTDAKSLMEEFFSLKMVVVVLDTTLSSKGLFICVQHSAGEPWILNTALEKPMAKILSAGVVHYVKFLMMNLTLCSSCILTLFFSF
jgi:hypothetical protein